MDKILSILQEIQLPFAYNHFTGGESPELPFICPLIPGSNNFAADVSVYVKVSEFHIELYTDSRTPSGVLAAACASVMLTYFFAHACHPPEA